VALIRVPVCLNLAPRVMGDRFTGKRLGQAGQGTPSGCGVWGRRKGWWVWGFFLRYQPNRTRSRSPPVGGPSHWPILSVTVKVKHNGFSQPTVLEYDTTRVAILRLWCLRVMPHFQCQTVHRNPSLNKRKQVVHYYHAVLAALAN